MRGRAGGERVSGAVWRAALYARLSREDGDKPESDSIANQKSLLEDFLTLHPELTPAGLYVDDGYTGTNFARPDFQRMVADIQAGRVDCVVVKDLSRFGRDYIGVGRYLERWFPERGVRFVAVNDGIDSEKGPYDLLLPVKNVFNEQYARDISAKVRSAMAAKQRQGRFIGAFACYGYRKDPEDHNRLVVDPWAAQVVRRVFALYEGGMGKIKIAKTLNGEGVPCPSEYKRQCGLAYHNGNRLGATTYWTYATIHRMLQNSMYTGTMVQGKAPRRTMHGRARPVDREQWIAVEGTHEAVIPPDQWRRVQALLEREARTPELRDHVGAFAGFLRCGDCGRAMCKTGQAGRVCYCCGSYKRYGPTVCSPHRIALEELEAVVLGDLNRLLARVEDWGGLAEEAAPRAEARDWGAERERLARAAERLYRLKKAAYEDYREGLVGREDYQRYRADYEEQERLLAAQGEELARAEQEEGCAEPGPWAAELLTRRELTRLDRITVAETVREIRVFEEGRLEIAYTFADEPGGPEE